MGLTEAEAVKRFGRDQVRVYTSGFANLWYGPFPLAPEDKPKTNMKLVTLLPDERVLGIHMIGKTDTSLPFLTVSNAVNSVFLQAWAWTRFCRASQWP